MEQKNWTQVLGRQHDFVIVMSQPVIEDIGDRSDEDKEDELKESDEGGEEVANADFVYSSAVSLG